CGSCGPSSTPASDLIAGIFTVSNSGSYSFTGEESKAGGISSFNDAATVSVASNGRVSAVGGARPPLLYLVSPSKAFVMLVDGGVYAGFGDANRRTVHESFSERNVRLRLDHGDAPEHNARVRRGHLRRS